VQPYSLDESEDGFGKVFIPHGPWQPLFAEIVSREQIAVVRLSAAMGWQGTDLSFLAQLTELRGIEIYAWDIRDASVISKLSTLRLVGLQADLRTRIDLALLPALEVVKATWKKAIDSVFACKTLRYLNLVNYPAADLSSVAGMTSLTRLALTSRHLSSLQGLAALASLKSFDLDACPKLESISGLDACKDIEHLEITSSKAFRDASPIAALRSLNRLRLDDCGEITTLEPLRSCQALEYLSFVGTTRIADGDLSFIDSLPRLRHVQFAPRRHYNRTPAELNASR
jgi:hypothetical protein